MPWDGGHALDVALLVLMQPIQLVVYLFTNPYAMSMTSTIMEVTMEVVMTVVLSGVTLLLVAARLIDEAFAAKKTKRGSGVIDRISGDVECTGCDNM